MPFSATALVYRRVRARTRARKTVIVVHWNMYYISRSYIQVLETRVRKREGLLSESLKLIYAARFATSLGVCCARRTKAACVSLSPEHGACAANTFFFLCGRVINIFIISLIIIRKLIWVEVWLFKGNLRNRCLPLCILFRVFWNSKNGDLVFYRSVSGFTFWDGARLTHIKTIMIRITSNVIAQIIITVQTNDCKFR